MARIYKAAAALIAEAGLTDEQVGQIEGTGAKGAIGTEDVRAFLAKGSKSLTQQDIIRDGLMKGRTPDEIVEDVLKVFPDSKIKKAHISWTKGNEKRKDSDWWKQYQRVLSA